jgi:hypothetical protein
MLLCIQCHAGNCSAPIFSFTKPWVHGCSAPPCSTYDDILHPVMNHPFDTLFDYPWEQKQDKAFMRAGIYAAMAHNCSRVQLYSMAQTQKGKQWLDVGIYKNRHWKVRVKTVGAGSMGMGDTWGGAWVIHGWCMGGTWVIQR